MSTGPARTRSLRRPAPEGSRNDKSIADIPTETPRGRGNVSPSRLPKPPSTATASASLSRPTNISRPVTGSGNGSNGRPSSQRTSVSRPPLTSDNKTPSLRTGARTPTEANSSLQRAPSTRHSRNSSTSALPSRPPSSGGNNNTTTRTQLFPPSASTLIRPPSSASTSTTTTNRPAFSTLQQHFSPARSLAPKPATHTFLAPPSPSKLPAALAASAETARLQAELLQLHLLHRSALPTYTQFRRSAHTKLHTRFCDVRAANEDLVELEALETNRRNVCALKTWADAAEEGGARGWGGLDEKIQVLDQVLNGVWKLSEPSSSGRYARVIKRFERWIASVTGVLKARKDGIIQREESMFIEELDTEWKDEVQNLSRKLSHWTQQLQALGDIPMNSHNGQGGIATTTSSLALVIKSLRELVVGMGEEVRTMERVERTVMAKEEEWVREAIEGPDGDDEVDGCGGVAVWRMG